MTQYANSRNMMCNKPCHLNLKPLTTKLLLPPPATCMCCVVS